MKKRGPLLAAFCIPLLITLIICVNREIYPFGDQCMLHIDMYHQYCPFFTELMEKLKTGGSTFYSWNIGLGADFVSLYAYYLASPLNWLLILWPRGYVIEFMTALSILKIALSGLTFTYYLGEHFLVWQDAGNAAAVIRTEKKTAVRLPADVASYAAALCGAAYALCAFMAAYAWNLMWTDCMVLAPLVILGLERLIRDNRPGLYYVSLAVCILSNYYISIMICIFLVLWFLLYWMEHRVSGYRAWIRFAWYSLLAGATGAVLILPTAKVLSLSGASGISFPETMEWYFNIVSELARSLLAVDVYTEIPTGPICTAEFLRSFCCFCMCGTERFHGRKNCQDWHSSCFSGLAFQIICWILSGMVFISRHRFREDSLFCTRFWYL